LTGFIERSPWTPTKIAISRVLLFQLAACACCCVGMVGSVYRDGEEDARRLHKTLLNAVSHDATDALLQGDEVQLLSSLRLLQGQYPALTYAKLIWRSGNKSVVHRLGEPSPGARVQEESVRVAVAYPRPSAADIVIGVDTDILRAASRRIANRVLIGMLMICALMAAIELHALPDAPDVKGERNGD